MQQKSNREVRWGIILSIASLIVSVSALFGVVYLFKMAPSFQPRAVVLDDQPNDVSQLTLDVQPLPQQPQASPIVQNILYNQVQELSYRIGADTFFPYCSGGLSDVSAADLFETSYYTNLVTAMQKANQDTDDAPFIFPWMTSVLPGQSVMIHSVCKDGDMVYLFGTTGYELGGSIYGIGAYNIQTGAYHVDSVGPVFVFSKGATKVDDDTIAYTVVQGLCWGPGDNFTPCDALLDESEKFPLQQPEMHYTISTADLEVTDVAE